MDNFKVKITVISGPDYGNVHMKHKIIIYSGCWCRKENPGESFLRDSEHRLTCNLSGK
jgi:hypothetical protein